MKKMVLLLLSICIIPVLGTIAGDTPAKPIASPPAFPSQPNLSSMQDLTVSGTLLKKQKGEKSYFVLQTTDCEARITQSQFKKDDKTINLDDYVNSEVTISGKGLQKGTDGKKRMLVHIITNITKTEKKPSESTQEKKQ